MQPFLVTFGLLKPHFELSYRGNALVFMVCEPYIATILTDWMH